MSDIVVRQRRRRPLAPTRDAAARAGQAVLFAVMVAPTVLLWALVVHTVFFRR